MSNIYCYTQHRIVIILIQTIDDEWIAEKRFVYLMDRILGDDCVEWKSGAAAAVILVLKIIQRYFPLSGSIHSRLVSRDAFTSGFFLNLSTTCHNGMDLHSTWLLHWVVLRVKTTCFTKVDNLANTCAGFRYKSVLRRSKNNMHSHTHREHAAPTFLHSLKK